MDGLTGGIVQRKELTDNMIENMYRLMEKFYDNMNHDVFLMDLNDKDYCIILKDSNGELQGLSTQKIITFEVGGKPIHGIFSGDTIINKEHWGSFELIKIFASFFFMYETKYENFYWFLISKGYKTYRFLPAFFKSFYPNYKEAIPQEMQEIIHAFGEAFYKDEYNRQTGVIEYKIVKDCLKKGVADINEGRLKDKNIAFFVKINPFYQKGNDVICIAKLSKDNLRPRAKKLLFG